MVKISSNAFQYLKNLENRGYDIGSDEEPSDDRVCQRNLLI